MKKYVALSVLAMTALGVVASHLAVEERDHRYLLIVDGAVVDVHGHVNAALNQATRRCDAITQIRSDELLSDPSALAIRETIGDYSPPDSRRLKMLQLISSGPWFLAEVEFSELQPAVILLAQNANGWAIHHDSIWSGSTQPWLAGPWIRRYLSQRAPQVPSALWACFDPTRNLFDSH